MITFDYNTAPARVPVPFEGLHKGDLTHNIMHWLVSDLGWARSDRDRPRHERRYDFLQTNSRLAVVVQVDGNRVRVEYSTDRLEPVVGPLAMRLARILHTPVTVSDYALECTVPADRQLPETFSRSAYVRACGSDVIINAEQIFARLAGGLLGEYRQQPREVGYRLDELITWDEPLYGTVLLEVQVERTGLSKVDDPRHDGVELGMLSVRLEDGNRDMLSHLVDLAAFVQQHEVTIVGRPRDGKRLWRFLFPNRHPASP